MTAAAADPYADIYVLDGTTNTLTNVVTWTGDHSLIPSTGAGCSTQVVGGTATLNAASGKRAFIISSGDSLHMYGITLSGGAPNSGLHGGDVEVQSGGSFYMSGGSLTYGTTTAANGGCLAGAAGTVLSLYNGASVNHCTADGDGGGIWMTAGSTLYLSDLLGIVGGVDVSWNTADNGGGIAADGADVFIQGSSDIHSNIATFEGGGIFLTGDSADATLTLLEDEGNSPQVGGLASGNMAGTAGGGLAIEAPSFDAAVDAEDDTAFGVANSAPQGAGISMDQSAGVATLTLEDRVKVQHNGDYVADDGGGIYIGGGTATLYDDVEITDNYAISGAGVFVDSDGELDIYGSDVTAPHDNTYTVDGGVRFDANHAESHLGAGDGTGGAIFVDGGVVSAGYLVVQGTGGESFASAVELVNGAVFSANRSHFNYNLDVFHVASGSSLTVEAEFGEAACDVLGGDFWLNRYCSEIGWNLGQLLVLEGEGSEAFVLATAIMENTANNEHLVVVGDGTSLNFTTDMVGLNKLNETVTPTSPMIVEVQSGGEFTAKQNTFGDLDLPVTYEAGSTGDFRRNAAYDAGTGAGEVAVVVSGSATVTGNQNIGDWSGAISSAFANGTAPGWVYDSARGDFHLDINSAAVDTCTTDGDWDIEGRRRPQPYPNGDWDAGAIELHQQ